MNLTEINAVIGSWGSYNACNKRALGSKWLNFADYDSWEDIEEELKKQGFELDGIDEELFIQDIEDIPSNCTNWDDMSPKTLFNILKDSGICEENYKYEVMQAYLEVCSLDEFIELVDSKGSRWDDDKRIKQSYQLYPPLNREDNHILIKPVWEIIPISKVDIIGGIWREAPF